MIDTTESIALIGCVIGAAMTILGMAIKNVASRNTTGYRLSGLGYSIARGGLIIMGAAVIFYLVNPLFP